jgi:hypothetical protein
LVAGLVTFGCARDHEDPSGNKDRSEDGDRDDLGEVAEAVAPSGSPEFCRDLVEEPGLVDVGDAIAELTDPATAVGAGERVRAAAAGLRSVGVPDSMRDERDAAADALDRLVDAGLEDKPTDEAAAALEKLGEEVQAQCDFPQG